MRILATLHKFSSERGSDKMLLLGNSANLFNSCSV